MRTTLYVILSVLTFSSCSYYYYPTTQVVPLQTEKNELIAKANVNLEVESFEMSYTISDHIGVMATYANFGADDDHYVIHEDGDEQTRVYFEGKSSYNFDIGSFYYNSLNFNIRNLESHVVYALLGSYGYADQRQVSEVFEVDMHRFYLQPSIALTNHFFDIGTSCRFTYANYGLDIKDPSKFYREDHELYNIETDNFYFWEPNVFLRVGYKWVKIGAQLGTAVNLTDNKINYENEQFSYDISLRFKLNDLFQQ